MKFCFGKPHDHHSVYIEAKNLEHAIKIFKVSELFPEECVDKIYHRRNSEGYFETDYDNILKRDNIKFKIDNPKISIYQEDSDEQHKWDKVGSVGLQECINVDYRDLMPQVNLLEAPKVIEEDEGPKETLPVVSDSKSLSSISSKITLREKHDEIARRKAELEAMVSEMNNAMSLLKAELKQKQKIVYIIETYLGMNEEIVQIAEGDPAPNGTKLSLFQQKLFMDEEVGIWDDRDGQGLDFKDIEQFDEWILKNYEKFAYDPLSIVVWQVRRREKKYNDIWSNVQFNHWNKTTYFLIRNGSRLYRIWSNVQVDDRLFPTKNEYINIINEEKKWGDDRVKEKLQDKHEGYLYGLIAIQGLIERTDVLGTWFRKNGVNLLSPRNDMDDYIKFIRDAEVEFWISDGRPRWDEFLRNNRESIKLGSRVCISTEKFYFSLVSSNGDNDYWRCRPYRPAYTPSRGHCYSVEAFEGESTDTYFPHGTTVMIRYQPEDCAGYDPYTYEPISRKRRVPWFFYGDEIINFDEISMEEADYYMKSRIDRERYLTMLPTLHWIREIKLKEKDLEEEFTKMIAGKLNLDLNDENKKKIEDTIQWWKLKNKWKRAVTLKESTATRMILNRLKKSL